MAQPILVLDTHVWIWSMNGEIERLSAQSRMAIEQASATGSLGVVAISVWEVGMLESKGRIRFAEPCLDWVRKALTAPGLHLLPLTPEIAIETSRLPGVLHRDPADRMLAATARILGGVLVTHDHLLLEYGNQGFVSVLQA
ncbi:MAG: type II toxin-antitoxin system VapC family toxin [Rhizonema sp. NSF051]|nr:type II toxin-antitoxin system VapC family toxin [Rhizonema sp. NSF051]